MPFYTDTTTYADPSACGQVERSGLAAVWLLTDMWCRDLSLQASLAPAAVLCSYCLAGSLASSCCLFVSDLLAYRPDQS